MGAMNFAVTTERHDATAVISLTGEVDLYTAPEFKQELVKAIEGWAENVVVDLSATSFIDSTTLGVLVSGVKRLRPQGGQIVLVVGDHNIRKIFEITGLDRVFSIYEMRDDALRALASSDEEAARSD